MKQWLTNEQFDELEPGTFLELHISPSRLCHVFGETAFTLKDMRAYFICRGNDFEHNDEEWFTEPEKGDLVLVIGQSWQSGDYSFIPVLYKNEKYDLMFEDEQICYPDPAGFE